MQPKHVLSLLFRTCAAESGINWLNSHTQFMPWDHADSVEVLILLEITKALDEQY